MSPFTRDNGFPIIRDFPLKGIPLYKGFPFRSSLVFSCYSTWGNPEVGGGYA